MTNQGVVEEQISLRSLGIGPTSRADFKDGEVPFIDKDQLDESMRYIWGAGRAIYQEHDLDSIVVLTHEATKAGVSDYAISKFVRAYNKCPRLILETGHRIGRINHRNEIDATLEVPGLSPDDIRMLLENLTQFREPNGMYGSIEWITRSTASGRLETDMLPSSHKKAFFRDSMYRLKEGGFSSSQQLDSYFEHFCSIEGRLAGIKFPEADQPHEMLEYTPENDYRARISEFE